MQNKYIIACVIAVVLLIIIAYESSGYIANWWYGGGLVYSMHILPYDMRAPTNYVVTSTPGANGINVTAWAPIKKCAYSGTANYYNMAGTAVTATGYSSAPKTSGMYCLINNVWQPITIYAQGSINGVMMNYYTFTAYTGTLPTLPAGITAIPQPVSAAALITAPVTAPASVTTNESFSTTRACPHGFRVQGGACRLCPVVGGQPVC
jgi:hypothetical protein